MPAHIYDKPAGYRIGAVARLTGLSADNLRVWERRYQAVTPARTGSGDRYYALEDVARLKLMKKLVDSGDSISAIAALDEEELERRLAATRPTPAVDLGTACALVVIGEAIGGLMESARGALSSVTLLQTFKSAADFDADDSGLKADVLVVEQATLHDDIALRINEWIDRVQAHTAIVIYRFAARHALARLPSRRCVTLRAPVDPFVVQKQCVIRSAFASAPFTDEEELHGVNPAPVPPRRFDDQTLVRVAEVSSTIRCECPRHLSELISSLSAFEKYSNECETRNMKDVALHAHLNDTAARARYLIENALGKVIEVDNIPL